MHALNGFYVSWLNVVTNRRLNRMTKCDFSSTAHDSAPDGVDLDSNSSTGHFPTIADESTVCPCATR